ncbi:MAG: TetR/AcrR family transcriptional regulator [Actinobacteria bacterium]|nr:TetR/AcrR family transcriptional regulator [Actinomycetota bacterium]
MSKVTQPESSGQVKRGRPRQADLAARILAAMDELVAERGYSKTTLDDVSRAVGTAKTTLYRRWPSKGDLAIDALAEALGSPPDQLPRRADGMRTAVAWLAGRVRRPGVRKLLLGLVAEAADDPALRAKLRARIREPFVERLAGDWQLPRTRVDLAFDLVVGTLLHRLAMTGRITGGDAEAVTALANDLLFTSNDPPRSA